MKHTRINNLAINLIKRHQLLYEPIYSLGPVELEILKTYIETNLANNFIKSSKFLIGASILFIKKLNSSFWLCIDYRDLSNLTI